MKLLFHNLIMCIRHAMRVFGSDVQLEPVPCTRVRLNPQWVNSQASSARVLVLGIRQAGFDFHLPSNWFFIHTQGVPFRGKGKAAMRMEGSDWVSGVYVYPIPVIIRAHFTLQLDTWIWLDRPDDWRRLNHAQLPVACYKLYWYGASGNGWSMDIGWLVVGRPAHRVNISFRIMLPLIRQQFEPAPAGRQSHCCFNPPNSPFVTTDHHPPRNILQIY